MGMEIPEQFKEWIDVNLFEDKEKGLYNSTCIESICKAGAGIKDVSEVPSK